MSKKAAAHVGAKATVWQQLRKLGPLRLTLGGVALAGVGAAATSAGWTGNVIFSAPTSATKFVLQGSTSGTTCDTATGWTSTTDPSATNGTLTLTLNDFGSLEPGSDVTKNLWVRNASTSNENANVAFVANGVTLTGNVFGSTSPSTGTVHPTITSDAATFTGTGGTSGGPTVTVTMTGADDPLAPFASTATSGCVEIAVHVTTPSAWDYAYQGTSGTLTVQVQGQSTTDARS